MKLSLLMTLGLLIAALNLQAGTPSAAPADKSHYTLFNPTPEAQMRDFDADRPGSTNSPHTLDAGHVQLEMDLLSYTRNDDGGIRSENWSMGDSNLRLGLTNWADLQFLIPAWQSIRVPDKAAHRTLHTDGIGDLTIGLKTNFWGNEDGDTAGGLAMYVKTPTATHDLGNGKVEGSALLLFGASLPADFNLGINSGVGILANDSGGYQAAIINSIAVSHSIAGPVSAYVEFFSSVPSQQSSDWVGTVDAGLTIMLGKTVQLDTGVNVGVTHAANDLQAFMGMSVRF